MKNLYAIGDSSLISLDFKHIGYLLAEDDDAVEVWILANEPWHRVWRADILSNDVDEEFISRLKADCLNLALDVWEDV